jgi:hypothetical protein
VIGLRTFRSAGLSASVAEGAFYSGGSNIGLLQAQEGGCGDSRQRITMLQLMRDWVQLRAPHERTIGSLASAGAGFNPENVLYCIV